ncbi:hypothetical protein BJG93_36935 (plasmid) [Paraburkholderia sprentiae WSM5005]|uniref:3-hydroxyacyl-CoA dehydrogenase C-terminal domain-containing protein n=1 Tax=Paraburkholderia sprentiae WSM5005 TaxID=754502 RepID=A0A8F4KJF5_9BURK|nr:hypothetical protein BJG93_36935 [Paraburkholderia sprentiae WSM5005]
MPHEGRADTVLAILEVLSRDFNDPKYRPAPLLRELVDAEHLGRKSGAASIHTERRNPSSARLRACRTVSSSHCRGNTT